MRHPSEDRTRLAAGLHEDVWMPNISHDSRHGIGAWWSGVRQRHAARRGRNGEPSIRIPNSYQRMALDDVRDLFAFLKTLPAEAVIQEPQH